MENDELITSEMALAGQETLCLFYRDLRAEPSAELYLEVAVEIYREMNAARRGLRQPQQESGQ